MRGEEKKTRKGFIIFFIIFLAATGVYLAWDRGYITFGPRIKKTVIKAYRLYTAEESKKEVMLFLGYKEIDGFRPYKTFVYETQNPLNQIKQAILLLLGEPPAGYISLIPVGTCLREAYLDSNNILYADFTEEIMLNHKGGTTGEYLTIYSIANTVFHNFPWVKGLRILVDGKETDTLAGHIDISGIILPEEDFSSQQN